jgi:hypothetical protein
VNTLVKQSKKENLKTPTEESGSSQRNSEAGSALNSVPTSKLNPAVKDWMDNVFISAMVRLYLAGKN